MKRLLQYLATWRCQRFGHPDHECRIDILSTYTGLIEHHTHRCIRCQQITLDAQGPLNADTRAMLADFGINLEEQRAVYLN